MEGSEISGQGIEVSERVLRFQVSGEPSEVSWRVLRYQGRSRGFS